MNGIDFIADTNFLIYLLEGRAEVEAFADFAFAVSFITEIELLGRKGITEEAEVIIRQLLDTCVVIDLNSSIKARAITLKQQRTIKLPDALIAATSLHTGLPLLTADTGFTGLPDLDIVLLTLV